MKRLCNRCNAEKKSNAPCEKCGCQEFRIIGPPCPCGDSGRPKCAANHGTVGRCAESGD